ncbi:hypothetical protein BO83DRAFT_432737 [Aspergillus eucalypticola CBS 122712]|uniref:Zn(2)-C6 fungal-type domain-containing protein n=1 Tax=Aspergillus eucalypticola (strain CBS 122712 / IBT 29274) TaxID=1448314 RepID=A0A317UK86_ASPEC|nr:uncharacterized protein BO83DRAFT_432737 [Aspergillus eucalypticola CBS 122712]PWY62101.1 hypothetical protein BO83DRAFT_432737 [Aspergillus eucalypticola CBS 122712]
MLPNKISTQLFDSLKPLRTTKCHHVRSLHSQSRQGCLTCRDKKVKCDETRPRCLRCIRLNRDCDYSARMRKKYTRRAQQASSLDLTSSPVSSVPQPSPVATSLGAETSYAVSSSHTLQDEFVLSKFDHEAIDHVLFIMAPKTLSQDSPMLLHMLCALGSMKLCHNPTATEIPQRKSEATANYGAGLRMLNSAIHHLSRESDLDYSLATLWLMISYELAHGDGRGSDLSVRLRGAAVLLQGRLRGVGKQASGGKSGARYRITPLAAQLLLWIAMVDGSAALNGVEATFNNLLGDSMLDGTNNDPAARLVGFSQLQRHATMVYHNIWGTNYPQNKLIRDIQCSQILCL